MYPLLNSSNSGLPSNSALAATRTSSFAAALRKLAKQAFDPLVDDKGQPYFGSSLNHVTNLTKHSSTFPHHNPYQTAVLTTPSVTTPSSAQRLIVESNTESRNSENYSLFDHRLPYFGSANLSSSVNKHSSVPPIHNPYPSAIVTTSVSMPSNVHRHSIERNCDARNLENYSIFDHRLAAHGQSTDTSKETIHTPSATSPITPLR